MATQKSPYAEPSLVRRFLRFALWAVLAGMLFLTGIAMGVSLIIYKTVQDLPSYEEIRQIPSGTTIRYFSSDNELLHSEGPEYGEWVDYQTVPVTMRKAIIAVEDRRFREHKGVDPIALARAVKFAWDNWGTGRRLQGASTITQQIARTLFLDRKYDVQRKLDEMIVAMALEQKLTKNQILELYLNKVYFGGGSYGIDAASRTFFGHEATTLGTEEAALLAGMVKAPSDYSPTADPEAAEGRMRVVLGLMRETGQDPGANAQADMPQLALNDDDADSEDRTGSRHFIDWIEPQIAQISPGLTGRIDIYTTLDSNFQTNAQTASESLTPSGTQSAIVTIEENGAIRAMVGGLDYANSNYNRATQALRQPGSAFKLFVYLTALESGYGPQSRVFDGPVTINGWSPKNNSGRYSGNLAMKTAFTYSLNTVAARLGQKLGTDRISQMAQRLGISTPVNQEPSMVLGTSEVRLLDLTRAYATISTGGLSVSPYGIERIEQNGKPVFTHRAQSRQIMVARDIAASMTSLLRGVVETGTARAAQIGRPVAGKTGTTNSNKDGWFLGFSSGLTTGVWVGRDDAKPIPGLQGGRAPAAIFSAYMSKAVKGRPSGFETIDPPRVDAPDLRMSETEALQAAGEPGSRIETVVTEAAGEPVAPPVVQPQTVAPTPPSRQGQSRAIRPDE